MKLINPDDNKLTEFFGKKKEKSNDGIYRLSLEFSKEEEEIIKDGHKALPRDKKALRDYAKAVILNAAKKDKEKGILLQKALQDLDNKD